MSRATFRLILSCSVLVAATGARGQPAGSDEQAAAKAFQTEDWSAAATAYGELVKSKPQDAQALFRWGVALHELGRYAEAVAALEHAERLGSLPPMVHFRLAKAQARVGAADAAVATLLRAAEKGFFGMPMLESDPDLPSVRAHGRFGEVRRAIDRNFRPCVYRPEYRALDFWVGEWHVRPTGAPDSAPPSLSRVELIEDQCVVYESYINPNGYSGRSFNTYEPETKRWEQFWVDNKGARHHYSGEARDGNLYYRTEGVRAAGPGSPPALVKMTFFNQGPVQVRQLGEQSTDDGKTWSVVYDLTYRRRQAPSPAAAAPPAQRDRRR